jgi:hypothetical protein
MLGRRSQLIVALLSLSGIAIWYAFRAPPERASSDHASVAIDPRMRLLQEELDACSSRAEHTNVEVASAERATPAAVPTMQVRSEWRSPHLSPEQSLFAERRQYGVLFRELDLTDDEAEKLLRILVVQPIDRDAVSALLGADRAARFDAARKTLIARADIRALRNDLELAGGGTLTSDQQQSLLGYLVERGVPPLPVRKEGESPGDAAARTTVWLEEREHALREAATQVLSPRQLQLAEEGMALRRAREPFRAPTMVASGAAGAYGARR